MITISTGQVATFAKLFNERVIVIGLSVCRLFNFENTIVFIFKSGIDVN